MSGRASLTNSFDGLGQGAKLTMLLSFIDSLFTLQYSKLRLCQGLKHTWETSVKHYLQIGSIFGLETGIYA